MLACTKLQHKLMYQPTLVDLIYKRVVCVYMMSLSLLTQQDIFSLGVKNYGKNIAWCFFKMLTIYYIIILLSAVGKITVANWSSLLNYEASSRFSTYEFYGTWKWNISFLFYTYILLLKAWDLCLKLHGNVSIFSSILIMYFSDTLLQ